MGDLLGWVALFLVLWLLLGLPVAFATGWLISRFPPFDERSSMAQVVTIERGSDEPVLIPAAGSDPSWTVTAVVRTHTDGPDLHKWSTTDGTAAIEDGHVVLFTSGADTWSWTSGEFYLVFTGPDGSLVRGPIRVRLRGT